MAATHLHLDPVGGMAGDMFIAALLHAFPEHAAEVSDAATLAAGVACRAVNHRDDVLAGTRFVVGSTSQPHHHQDRHRHDHAAWRTIRTCLEGAAIDRHVRSHAIAIFTLLAEAEAAVHGIAPDDVTFHEVGNADSIADIVAAAWLIAAFDEATWSVGALPLGGGMVDTAHSRLPVPAPATALLLRGLDVIDDGIQGERVTPTGAAILRHLACTPRAGLCGRITRTGIGFGTNTLPDRSNVLRVLVLDSTGANDTPRAAHRDLAVIGFEVDDQSAEDLAAGLDRLRALPGVHDVLQMPAFGKKGRIATHVQVLVHPDALDDAVAACFSETTTIGLRTHLVRGHALARTVRQVAVGPHEVRVKLVDRPGGRTGKAEAADLLPLESQAARARLRRDAEQLAEASEHA